MSDNKISKSEVKSRIIGLGADLCGVANIRDFDDAPAGFSPADIFAPCKSVLVFGIAMPKGLTDVAPRLVYHHFNNLTKDETDRIAFWGARVIEHDCGGHAVPMPSDGPYEEWNKETLRGHGLVSVKHAAVKAGLGTLGKNTIFLNPEFGNLLTLGYILTDLDLESDPASEDICIPGCSKCVDACPVHAIKDGVVDQYLCRTHTYNHNARGFETTDCNACRSVCPMRFGK